VLLDGPESHPWLAAASGAPQGKREHVETILQIQHFFDRRTDWTLPVLHPLMAQPLMELCLRIPSWTWAENGRDRSVARDAFKGLVPNSVLSRRMKGSLQGFIRRAFESLRPDLRALLLEGELRRTGILDVAAIEAVFADGWDADAPQLRLTEMASLELWMRSWRQ
jgi:asparagine synthase (glutamine-hydrolysing)